MEISLGTVLIIDVAVLIACVTLLVRFCRISHSHPIVIYLFFHIYTFTTRMLAVLMGAPTLFSTLGAVYDKVTEPELVRAGLMADVALIAMTAGWLRAPISARRKIEQRGGTVLPSTPLRFKYVWSVVAVAFPIGCASFAAMTFVPGMQTSTADALGDWENSSWITITTTWPGLCLLALIYCYGFRWWLITPMSLYLLAMSLQGYHRFRVIIPAILLIQIYLDRKNLRWPPARLWGAIVAIALLFYPLKYIGKMVQEGDSLNDISDTSKEIVLAALTGEHDDQGFMDQMASAVTLVDEHGKFFYGKPYVALLTLPIPRQWWETKPTPVDHVDEFSVPSRPMREMGMILTHVGEDYANFGYAGIVIVPFLLAFWLARGYFYAYLNDYYSLARFTYLLVACNLIQVFRDGLVSIFMHTCVNMMPLVIIVLLHLFLRGRTSANNPEMALPEAELAK